jgi:hypothetical protein
LYSEGDGLAGGPRKDRDLYVIRVDRTDGTPLAILPFFGMHGTLGDIENGLVSSDAGGGLETVLEESFDDPVVVMFTQGSGGDASPGGSQDGFAVAMRTLELEPPTIPDPNDPEPGQQLRFRQMAAAALGVIGRAEALPARSRAWAVNW